jgi:histidyl-tRNA synthetase
VLEELQRKGFTATALEKLLFLFDLPATQEDRWALVTEQRAPTSAGKAGLQAMQQVLAYVKALGIKAPSIMLDPTLARGLSYYTGTIFEVKVQDMAWGSIGGGGRYDGLTDVFGLPGVSGVGFSFGMDRLYAVLDELDLFPPHTDPATQVMLANLDQASESWALQVLAALRSHNIQAEIYPEAMKLKKQLQYAHKRLIPFVAIIGEEEQAAQMVALKDMQTGTQQQYSLDQLVNELS